MTVSLLTPEVAEVIEVMPVANAERLDMRIRLLVKSIDDNLGKLRDLLCEAKAGQIHVALGGFSSWTAYVADAVRFKPESIEQRRELVALMFGEGMSERAIAGVVGVSQKTVDRDLEHVSHDDSPEPCAQVIGLDGKTYPREQRKPIPERERPVTETIPEAVVKLTKAVDRLDRISDDARCAKNRAKLRTLCRSDLQRAIKRLQAVADKLGVAELVEQPAEEVAR